MLLFTPLSNAVHSSCAFDLSSSFSAVVLHSFPVSPCFQFVDGVGRDLFLVLGLLLAKDLFTCVVPELLAVSQLCFNVCLIVLLSALVAAGTCWKG